MDYFKILNLKKEPFSNSPDPDLFFRSEQHYHCLQQLELAIRLRRGLSVILGEVGTGKTTLCRQLIRSFNSDENITPHLILDPHVANAKEMLLLVSEMLTGIKPAADSDPFQIKEQIKNHLYEQGVDQGRTTILIIDEGQKIPLFCLEILREFLNYETNAQKLLQIVIFAQREFRATLDRIPNFTDRINLLHELGPLNFKDTCRMIRFRLEHASAYGNPPDIFTRGALSEIHRASDGYPRKIIHLCHRCLLALIIQNKNRADRRLVRHCLHQRPQTRTTPRRWVPIGATVAGLLLLLFLLLIPQIGGRLPFFAKNKPATEAVATAETSAAVIQPENVDPDQPAAGRLTSSVPATPPANPVAAAEASGQLSQEDSYARVRINRIDFVADLDQLPDEEYYAMVDHLPVHTADAAPAILGHLRMDRDGSLGWMIQTIYGRFDSTILNLVLLANPHIGDPNRVQVDEQVFFPEIKTAVDPMVADLNWLVLDRSDSLVHTYRLIQTVPAGSPKVRLIPYRNPGQPLTFAIILAKSFRDPAVAADYHRSLPQALRQKTEVMSLWTKESEFYADPLISPTQKHLSIRGE